LNLTQRLFLLVLVALLPAVGIAVYNQLDLRRSREAEVHDLALRQARLAASELNQILEGVRGVLTAVADVPSVRAADKAGCVDFITTLLPRMPHLRTIAVIDLEGRVACRQAPLPPATMSFADRPYFREAVESGGFVVGEFTEARVSGGPVLPVALALRDGGGRVTGVLAAALDLRWLSRHLGERALPKGGSLTVADRDGVILAREPLPERFVGTRIPDAFRHLVDAPEPGTLELTSQDGTRRVIGYVPASIPPRNVYVSTGLSASEAFADVDRATSRGVAISAAALAWPGRHVARRSPGSSCGRSGCCWAPRSGGGRATTPAGPACPPRAASSALSAGPSTAWRRRSPAGRPSATARTRRCARARSGCAA
jgi:hypothetical protein